jgi:hypothetical protein
MKFSNGIEITYGVDHLGPAIILSGNLSNNTLTGSPLWSKWENANKTDSRHCWRLTKTSELVRATNNSPIEYLKVAENILNTIVADKPHPALTNGYEAEAKRLFSGISTESNNKFVAFIAQIKAQYGIDETLEYNKEMVVFTDDIGPAILTIVDGYPSVLPEIPTVYRAPKDWVLFMWNINNHMAGPLLDSELADNKKIRFEGLTLDSKTLNPEQLGLYYFHIARFILIFEAWTGNIETPYLIEFIRLITKGIDPFENI